MQHKMTDGTSTKENFFQNLSNLDSHDDQIVDEGRLASEAFFNASRKGSSAWHRRGSSRETSPATSGQTEGLRPSNTTSRPFNVQKVQRTASTHMTATSLGFLGTYGNNKTSKEPFADERASNHPARTLQLEPTTSAPIITSTPSLMPSSSAPKMSGKRKRENAAPQIPEEQRMFKNLLFCTIQYEKSGESTDNGQISSRTVTLTRPERCGSKRPFSMELLGLKIGALVLRMS
jgi:hypothetical protein